MLSKAGSGYLLSRQWFDFAAENPELINVNQTALYAWLIELNNRRGWAEKFNFNANDACDLIGVKNRKTVWAALNKLVEFGFVTMIYKANAPGKVSAISIVNNRVLSNGCLDKSLMVKSNKRTGMETVMEQLTDRSAPGSGTMDGHSIKQENNKPQTINISFDIFWTSYDKKIDQPKCELLWKALTDIDRAVIIDYLPSYLGSTPNKKFRKNPETFLQKKTWHDEIILEGAQKQSTSQNPAQVKETVTEKRNRKLNEQQNGR